MENRGFWSEHKLIHFLILGVSKNIIVPGQEKQNKKGEVPI